MSAANILEKAAQHMQERAATYDKPDGERSMGATVQAFNVITGHALTEEQGWLFMALLKAVRSQQGEYRADSYEDGTAYFALMGEAAAQKRNGGWAGCAIKRAAFRKSCDSDEEETLWPDESRIDVIGQNGNDGAVYAERTLQEITRELMEYIDEPPDENCTCHINPPCSDCVEHSHLREVLAAARAIIYKDNDP